MIIGNIKGKGILKRGLFKILFSLADCLVHTVSTKIVMLIILIIVCIQHVGMFISKYWVSVVNCLVRIQATKNPELKGEIKRIKKDKTRSVKTLYFWSFLSKLLRAYSWLDTQGSFLVGLG